MKIPNKKNLFGGLAAGLLFLGSAHGEGSGVRFGVKEFSLYVEYNDMVPDRIMGMEYLRNPDGLLFDLIAIVQDNKDKLEESNRAIYAHVDGYNKYLSIYQNKPEKKQVFVDNDLSRLEKHAFVKRLCAAMAVDEHNCRLDKDQTHFYVTDRELESEQADVIEFGQFPGTNNQNYSLTDRWSPGKAEISRPRFSKVTVNRDTIYDYFDMLGAAEDATALSP